MGGNGELFGPIDKSTDAYTPATVRDGCRPDSVAEDYRRAMAELALEEYRRRREGLAKHAPGCMCNPKQRKDGGDTRSCLELRQTISAGGLGKELDP